MQRELGNTTYGNETPPAKEDNKRNRSADKTFFLSIEAKERGKKRRLLKKR